MKIPQLFLLAAVFALPGFLPTAARAFDIPSYDYGNDAPMPAAVVQLFTDLNSISPGASVSDAQHAALVADLDTLAVGVFTPDPADIDQLATDLGTAATDGLFSDNVLEYLADDFIGDPDDSGTDPDGWMGDLQDDVASLIDPPPAFTGDPGTDPTLVNTGIYETVVARRAAVSGSSTRVTVSLDAQGIPPFLLENYTGTVQLATRTDLGAAPVATFRLTTSGLPPSNPYTVSITRQSDGTSVTLGKLRVHAGFALLDVAAAPAAAVPQAELFTSGRVVFGGSNSKKALPAGFDATDVATVTVADSQGVVRLTGRIDGDQPSSQVQALTLHLASTSINAPAPIAEVSARRRITTGTTTVRFRLLARHLPASVPVTLWADGASVGLFTTTPKGALFIAEGFQPLKTNRSGGLLPFATLPGSPDLSGAKSFKLTDAQGTVLVEGSLD